MYYSALNRGFYSPEIHSQMPYDAKHLSDEMYSQLMEAQRQGKVVRPDENGLPIAEAADVTPPTSVTMRQARLALLGAGKLSLISTAIAALPSPQKEAAQIEWEYAATVERSSALTEILAASLQLSEADLDNLFTSAAAL